MSFVDDLIARLNDIDKRLRHEEKLDKNPTPGGYPTTSGTPTAGAIAYWTSASMIAAGGAVTYSSGNLAIAGTATSGTALSVTRNLTATSTDSPVVSILQDHASDDQAALKVTQDGTGALVEFLDAATKILAILDGGEVRINNATSASGFIRFAVNEVNKALIGVSGTSGGLITGDAADDLALRTVASKILFSNDNGVSYHFAFSGSSQPEFKLNAATGSSAIQRFAINLVNEGTLGVAGAANALVTGSATGDLIIRSRANKILFTLDDGTTIAAMLSGGNFAVGVSTPQGRLHVHDGTGGFLFVSKTGINGTPQTIIPDGTGDVTLTSYIRGVLSNGIPQAGIINNQIANGGTLDIDISGVGVNTLRFAVSAAGALTVVRLNGTATWAISVEVIWQ